MKTKRAPGSKNATKTKKPITKSIPKGVEFIDGVKSHLDNPHTFSIPADHEKEILKVGDVVKVGFRFDEQCRMNSPKEPSMHGHLTTGERFWTILTRVVKPGQAFVGVVNNDLTCTAKHHLKLGDGIEFEAKHILGIMTKEELEAANARRQN